MYYECSDFVHTCNYRQCARAQSSELSDLMSYQAKSTGDNSLRIFVIPSYARSKHRKRGRLALVFALVSAPLVSSCPLLESGQWPSHWLLAITSLYRIRNLFFSVSVQSTGNDPNSVSGVPHFAPARTFCTRSSLCEGHSTSINSYAPSRPSLPIDSVE